MQADLANDLFLALIREGGWEAAATAQAAAGDLARPGQSVLIRPTHADRFGRVRVTNVAALRLVSENSGPVSLYNPRTREVAVVLPGGVWVTGEPQQSDGSDWLFRLTGATAVARLDVLPQHDIVLGANPAAKDSSSVPALAQGVVYRISAASQQHQQQLGAGRDEGWARLDDLRRGEVVRLRTFDLRALRDGQVDTVISHTSRR